MKARHTRKRPWLIKGGGPIRRAAQIHRRRMRALRLAADAASST